MKRRAVQAGIFVCLILMTAALVPGCSRISEKVQAVMTSDVLLIDAGHGGIDGGAQSSRGVSEKAINLAVAQEVKALAEQAGWRVVMTRENDDGLYKPGSGAIRSLKTQDLKARRELIRKTAPQLAVSIHLNSFKEDPSVKGAQVFFPGSGGDRKVLEKSEELAKVLQKKVAETLQNGSDRTALAKSDVFLFKEVTCPIAIIECGFLSNPQEAELLQNSQYHKKLAEGIFLGITEFTGKTPRKNIGIVDSAGEKPHLQKIKEKTVDKSWNKKSVDNINVEK